MWANPTYFFEVESLDSIYNQVNKGIIYVELLEYSSLLDGNPGREECLNTRKCFIIEQDHTSKMVLKTKHLKDVNCNYKRSRQHYSYTSQCPSLHSIHSGY